MKVFEYIVLPIITGFVLLFSISWIWKKTERRTNVKISFLWFIILYLFFYFIDNAGEPQDTTEIILLFVIPFIGGGGLMLFTYLFLSKLKTEPRSGSALYLHYILMVFTIIYYWISSKGL
jgi:hypothetical protein